MRLSLTADDIRVLSTAIGWHLSVPHVRTPQPNLTQQDRQTLRILFNELCFQLKICQTDGSSVSIQFGEPYLCENGSMQLPQGYFRLLRNAMKSFFGEVGHSPTELEVLTGVSEEKARSLGLRMQIAEIPT